jgi:hypothetical protein
MDARLAAHVSIEGGEQVSGSLRKTEIQKSEIIKYLARFFICLPPKPGGDERQQY